MKITTMNMLVKFPQTSYFEFNKGLDGISVVDSIMKDKEGETYTANISCSLDNLPGCTKLLTSLNSQFIDISVENNSAPPRVSSRMKPRATKLPTFVKIRRGAGNRGSQIARVKEILMDGEYHTVPEISEKTGITRHRLSVMVATLAKLGMKKKKIGEYMGYSLDAKKAA